MHAGLVGDHHGEGGLTGAGRPPQDDRREEPVRLDRPAQQLAGSDDVRLPDEFIQGAWAHARRQGSFRFHAFVHGVGKEVHLPLIILPGLGLLRGSTCRDINYESSSGNDTITTGAFCSIQSFVSSAQEVIRSHIMIMCFYKAD